ncbi:46216_t:CDS:1, partial [Gigaspora margarita]
IEVTETICRYDSDGSLMIYMTKLYDSSNMFSQILSGSLEKSY